MAPKWTPNGPPNGPQMNPKFTQHGQKVVKGALRDQIGSQMAPEAKKLGRGRIFFSTSLSQGGPKWIFWGGPLKIGGPKKALKAKQTLNFNAFVFDLGGKTAKTAKK